MIDKIFELNGSRKSKSKRANFSHDIEDTFLGSELVNPGAKQLSVLFPSWHGDALKKFHSLLARRTQKANRAMVFLDLHDDILTSDPARTIQAFTAVRHSVAKEIDRLMKSGGYTDLHLIGISLGNVSLALVADQLKSNFKATFVAGSYDLAASTWDGTFTKGIRENLERQGFTREGIIKDWAQIAPSNNLRNFANKKVHVVLSSKDKVIPTAHQELLVEALQKAGANLSVNRTITGHMTTCIDFLVRGQL